MSSDRAKHWAWEIRHALPSGNHLLLLHAMGDMVGESLVCYASIDTLTDLTLSSDRTTRRHLDDLEALGRIRSQPRPGRTTIYQLLIPEDFGREQGVFRKARRTPVKLAGVDESVVPESGAANPGQNGRGDPGQIGRGPPRSEWPGARSNWPDTQAKMADDSSLDSSLLKSPKTRDARAGSGRSPARAQGSDPDAAVDRAMAIAADLGLDERGPREAVAQFLRRVGAAEGELFLLNNHALQLGISTRTASETLVDVRRRVDERDAQVLHTRAEALAAERAKGGSSAPEPEPVSGEKAA